MELLADLYDKYVVVLADKASNNIVFVCMAHHELPDRHAWFEYFWRKSYITCFSLSKEEILRNHESVLLSFGISTADEDLDFPKMYWIPR